jgi:hypothetical protein
MISVGASAGAGKSIHKLGVQKMQETDRNSTYQTKQLAHTHTNT